MKKPSKQDVDFLKRKAHLISNNLIYTHNRISEYEGILQYLSIQKLPPNHPHPFKGMMDRGTTVQELRDSLNKDISTMKGNLDSLNKELTAINKKIPYPL